MNRFDDDHLDSNLEAFTDCNRSSSRNSNRSKGGHVKFKKYRVIRKGNSLRGHRRKAGKGKGKDWGLS